MWAEVILMAVIQALTEFLPVSSSGHVVIIPAIVGGTDPMLTGLNFSVALHLKIMEFIQKYGMIKMKKKLE